MDKKEFDEAKPTFPWVEHIAHSKKGGIVSIVDRNGQEVPLFTITGFVEYITSKLSQRENPHE